MKRRLDKILVEHDADGNGTYEQVIRTYDLTYATSEADRIFPKITWTQGGTTPTLVKIQEYGLGSSTSLPPVTFTYGDDMHLTEADNGYSGKVAFTYDATPYYSSQVGGSKQFHNDFRSRANPTGLWHGNIHISENQTRWIVRVQGTAYRYFSASTVNHVRPGQAYRIYGAIIPSAGNPNQVIQVGLRVVNAEYPAAQTQEWIELQTYDENYNNFFILPATAGEIEAMVKCTDCNMDWFTVAPLVTRYR